MLRRADSILRFKRTVWAHYRKHGRHDLLWRKTRDPYCILVSEVMLQQTQVARVVFFYERFIERFPTPEKLAKASLSDVLKLWQGLGYNRRAKMLHQAAKEIAERGMPRDAAGFDALPGVGPYTARAVSAFAFGHDSVFVETNIRTAVIEHFFPKRKTVSDTDIEKILVEALPKGKAREWYYALMDYGAHLKRSGVSHNGKAKAYVKQPQFRGSLREARGAILRELAKGARARARLLGLIGDDRSAQMERALAALEKEGMVLCARGRWSLAS